MFEVEDRVLRIPSGKPGVVMGIQERPAPMIAVNWDDGTAERVPPELLRYPDKIGSAPPPFVPHWKPKPVTGKVVAAFERNKGRITNGFK
jgi:hypothetical protein